MHAMNIAYTLKKQMLIRYSLQHVLITIIVK